MSKQRNTQLKGRGLAAAFLMTVAGLAAPNPVAAGGVKLLKQPRTFPIIISLSGSYRLKSNIVVPDENTTAIQVNADDVTLDLGGFAIQGPTVCSSTPVTCTPTGTGIGIEHTGRNLILRNGGIVGMGNDGVRSYPLVLAYQTLRVDDVHVRSNGGNGIISYTAIVTNTSAVDNGIYGIRSAVVSNSIAYNNGGMGPGFGPAGIAGDVVNGCVAQANGASTPCAGFGCSGIAGHVVTGSSAVNNWDIGVAGLAAVSSVEASHNATGIYGGLGAVITNSTAQYNADIGIKGFYSTISFCSANLNGTSGTGYGIYADKSVLYGNELQDNSGRGALAIGYAAAHNRADGNTVANMSLVGGGQQTDANVCGTLVCP